VQLYLDTIICWSELDTVRLLYLLVHRVPLFKTSCHRYLSGSLLPIDLGGSTSTSVRDLTSPDRLKSFCMPSLCGRHKAVSLLFLFGGHGLVRRLKAKASQKCIDKLAERDSFRQQLHRTRRKTHSKYFFPSLISEAAGSPRDYFGSGAL
jgi:hypothetical protein